MEKDKTKHILQALFDEPLSKRDLLVNREKEIQALNMISSLQPSGLYGVCGETGIGKTTVLNFLEPDEGKRIYLRLTEKESKEVIIQDILYKLANETKKDGDSELSKISREAMEFVIEERTEGSSISASGGVVLTGAVSKSKAKTRRFNVYQAYDFLDRILDLLIKRHERVLLLIDELDKERKDDVLIILDSLKTVLNKKNLIVILSLPFAIYREYIRDRLRWNESGNLENILKDTLFLEPLNERDIQQMIMKRLKDFPDCFDAESLYEISRYSDGNPRDALWISQQIVISNPQSDRITGPIAIQTIRNVVERYFAGSWTLTDRQEKVLRAVLDYRGDRTALVKRLEQSGLKRQTAYTYINRLKKVGLIIERGNELRVSGKIFYLLSR
ncbi:MAG TPA: AAA family ATPase [Pseudothermotoga sp.]|nr:AAA family ATPase [Pseudothermotoga sp.]HOK83020.1 AAA family ATPase [Pseudothermotoga sp.]HPP69811.1 AAA family ATPase [Pseudothermotoga sp.]